MYCLIENGSYVVTPDNGSLTHMKKDIGIEAVREIDETKNRLETTREVNIFHGRDLFAYCAGKLAAGLITFEEVGPEYPVEDIVVHNIVEPKFENGKLSGMILSSSSNFGLIDSNIPYTMFDELNIKYGDNVKVCIKNKDKIVFETDLTYQPSFGYVKVGEPLVMISETKHLQIAKNLENITLEYGISAGPDWTIEFDLANRSK